MFAFYKQMRCVTVMHYIYHYRKYPGHQGKLKALYIKSKLPFPEVEKFTQISRDKYVNSKLSLGNIS